MVQIGGKPILWHIMKTYSYYGYNDFIISCGVKAHVIKNYFANYNIYNDDFSINMSDHSITFHSELQEKIMENNFGRYWFKYIKRCKN